MRKGYFTQGIGDLFTSKGRIDRVTYVIYGTALTIGTVILNVVVAGVLSFSGEIGRFLAGYSDAAAVIVAMPLLYAMFCLYARRLHDFGFPAVLALLGFFHILAPLGLALCRQIPWVQLPDNDSAEKVIFFLGGLRSVFSLCLLAVPGNPGPNRYGGYRHADDRPRAHVLEG